MRASRATRRAAFVSGLLGLLLLVPLGLAGAQAPAADAPLDTFAFVARSDNPVDALAASSIAGQLGGYVVLTKTTGLGEDAHAALLSRPPAVVVLAGGPAALSEQVALDVQAALPDASVRRVSGATRTGTARELVAILDELGVGRPVLTGAVIDGDVDILGLVRAGSLEVASTDRVDNLNAALLDGNSADAFAPARQPVEQTFTCLGTAFAPVASVVPTYTSFAGSALRFHDVGFHEFACPVDIPEGARIAALRVRATDTTPDGRVTGVRLARNDLTGGNDSIDSVLSVPNPTGSDDGATPGTMTLEHPVDHVVAPGTDAALFFRAFATREAEGGTLGLSFVQATYVIEDVPIGTPPAP